jgi:hypothetical protein
MLVAPSSSLVHGLSTSLVPDLHDVDVWLDACPEEESLWTDSLELPGSLGEGCVWWSTLCIAPTNLSSTNRTCSSCSTGRIICDLLCTDVIHRCLISSKDLRTHHQTVSGASLAICLIQAPGTKYMRVHKAKLRAYLPSKHREISSHLSPHLL